MAGLEDLTLDAETQRHGESAEKNRDITDETLSFKRCREIGGCSGSEGGSSAEMAEKIR